MTPLRPPGARNDRPHHPAVHRPPHLGAAGRRPAGGVGPGVAAPDLAGRPARPVGHPGHRAGPVSGPGAAAGGGPGDLSVDDGPAVGPRRQDGARLFLLWRLLRLRAVRRRHRSLLGPFTRGRVYQPGAKPAAGRRARRTGAGRHRRGLGLRIRAGGPQRRPRPGPAARAQRLVPQVRAENGGQRGRGGQHRRHGQAVPDRAGPGPAARLRHVAREGAGGGRQGEPGIGRLGGGAGRDGIHGPLARLSALARGLPQHRARRRRQRHARAAARRGQRAAGP